MTDEKQVDATVRDISRRPRYVVGMDAHSVKIAISVWEWSDPWNPVLFKEIKCFDISAMAATYERHVPLESLTLIEASTNSMRLKQELCELGFRAEVIPSNAIHGKEKKRKVRDIQDARNIAQGYMKGDIQEFVWTPPDETAECRDILFAYRDARKDMTRAANRIWSICNRKGYGIDVVAGKTTAQTIRDDIRRMDIRGIMAERLAMLVEEYELHAKRLKKLEEMMAEHSFGSDAAMALMQLPGIFYKAAFATIAAVGDARRFGSASKLAAYGGFAPILDTSGEEERLAAKRGGTGKPLDKEGRRDLKYYYVEAGHTVLNTCAATSIGKWGWRMLNRGKPKNKVACAIGRKLLTYAWHIMRGDPTPNREGEKFYRRKLVRFCSVLGKERMKELGFEKRDAFAEFHASKIYAGLSLA